MSLGEYVGSEPIARRDPSGLAELRASPESVAGMPWCKLKSRINPFIDPDTSMDKGIWGNTKPIAYNIECFCDCCWVTEWEIEHRGEVWYIMKQCYKLRCVVTAYLQIRINPWQFDKGFGYNDTYGHEQAHVKNLLDVARQVGVWAEISEKQLGCVSRRKCLGAAATSQISYQQTMNWARQREKDHQGPGGLAEFEPRRPIGKMPRTSDCSKPGTPPPITKGKKC